MTRIAILAALTILAGCSQPGRSYSTNNARMIDGIHVVGDGLTQEDVVAIRETIAASDLKVDKRVLSINQQDAKSVEVMTGEIRGPLDGGGDIILLEKVDGKWQIVGDGVSRGWVS